MWSIRLLLIETGIWLAPFTGVEGGDGASDASDGAGDRTTSSDLARDVLYMLKNLHFNCGGVEYSRTDDRETGIWVAPFTGVEGGDAAPDVGDGAGDRTISRKVMIACIQSVAMFGSELWWKGDGVEGTIGSDEEMQVVVNKEARAVRDAPSQPTWVRQ
jgi:hypothetical protein